MTKPILYLLAPGFIGKKGRREYCPECAEIWGVLSYFPDIKDALDIRYMPLEKPRGEMVGVLGEKHQNCPTLVLAESALNGFPAPRANGYAFIDNARDIGAYFAHAYGAAYPR